MTKRKRTYPELEFRTIGEWSWKSAVLWSKIQQGAADECWTWTGATGPHVNLFGAKKNGRPQMSSAARIIYMDITGQDVKNLEIKHTCGNRYCCNYNHFKIIPNHMTVEKRPQPDPEPIPQISLERIQLSDPRAKRAWWQL